MNATFLAHSVQQLAPGDYDVLLSDRILAAPARNEAHVGGGHAWQLELPNDMPAADQPSPITEQCQPVPSFGTALEWLGIRMDAAELSSNLREQTAS